MSSGLDWERFGVITGGDEVCILPPPTLSEKGVGIPTLVHFPNNNVSVQHNRGFLPGVIMLTQSYYHRGTHLNAMKSFCMSGSSSGFRNGNRENACKES